jgi:phosphomannomutase
MSNILTDVRVKTIRSLVCNDPEADRCIITVEKKGWADHVLTVKGRLATAAMKWLKKGALINVHTVSTDTNLHKVTAFDYEA